jgi:hypothetical protein
MNTHEWPCRIKSARRKKRLVKQHRDKQLIQLDKRRVELEQKRWHLPPVPLEHPYQRGWKRFFVLREDLKLSPKAAFYEALLQKINTVEYSRDKSFKRKKFRKHRRVYSVKPQSLREFDAYEWQVNRMGLTDEDKACFTRVETFSTKTWRTNINYVFAEPWRYVLKVAPHLVTHRTQVDSELEQELAWIEGYIEHNDFGPRIYLLTRGRRYRWKDEFNERVKYINKLKNIPRYSPTAAYLDLET